MRDIAKIGFITSLISYGVFALADYLRPGFVSFTFSVHWFLLFLIVFGVWWSIYDDQMSSSKVGTIVAWPIKIALGMLLFVIIWQEGEVFGDLRVFLALIGLLIPFFIPLLLRHRED
ncbi:MAG: hypothetical protein ABH846_03050 [Patescibacteria group bacterium]